MVASMTGYGRAEASWDGGEFTVEIRSLNHRFTDFSIRLPKTIAGFEARIKELLKKKIQRGYISYQLTWDRGKKAPAALMLNEEVISHYQELFKRMNEEFGIEGTPTVDTYSRLPDIFTAELEPEDEEELWKPVEQATSQALDALLEMRRVEGDVLAADILKRLEIMEEHMRKAKLRAPERLVNLETRLREKLSSLFAEEDMDENRILAEITFYADKWDFSEEEVRFRSHLEAMRETIRRGGPVGRRLSFLTQELNREVNTVASKANDAEIAQLMVAIKEEIEKVREQVENLE